MNGREASCLTIWRLHELSSFPIANYRRAYRREPTIVVDDFVRSEREWVTDSRKETRFITRIGDSLEGIDNWKNSEGMGEFQGDVTFGMGRIAKWWKITEYASLAVMFVLPVSNPVFKISTALHVALQSMILLFYSPIIYYNALSVSYNSNSSDSRGFLQKISGFVPNLMYKISILLLNTAIHTLRRLGLFRWKINVEALAALVTYSFIAFRKIIALCLAVYITAEDNESMHTKAFTIFTTFCLIEMKFVVDNKAAIKANLKNNITSAVMWNAFTSVFKISSVRLNTSLISTIHLVRKRIFLLAGALTALFIYYTFTNAFESFDDDFVWIISIKLLLALDALFVGTFFVDLSTLELNFSGPGKSMA